MSVRQLPRYFKHPLMSSVPGVADAALQLALVLGHVQGGWLAGN